MSAQENLSPGQFSHSFAEGDTVNWFDGSGNNKEGKIVTVDETHARVSRVSTNRRNRVPVSNLIQGKIGDAK